jgi:MFS family permease
MLYAGLSETPGATGGGGNAGRQAIESIALLWTDPPFRRFVAVRALLVSTALLTPFYAALARQIGDGGLDDLGLLLLASGAAAALSSAVWGRMADRSSRRVLELAALLAGSLSLAVAAWSWAGAPGPRPGLVMAAAFLAMAAAHAGIRVGRKTYLVDMAGPDNRATYVALSNTAIGVLLLAGGVFGWIAQWLGLPSTIGLLGIISLAGALGAVRLDEVTQ